MDCIGFCFGKKNKTYVFVHLFVHPYLLEITGRKVKQSDKPNKKENSLSVQKCEGMREKAQNKENI